MTEAAPRRRGPGSRADENHPTRHQLVSAALELAQVRGLPGLSVSAVTQHAGVAKGTFYVHFPDRAAFLVAIHQAFHDRLLGQVLTAIDGLSPGAPRLLTATTSYLDCCRAASGVKAMLREARAEPLVHQEVLRRNAEAVDLLAEDFAAMGADHPPYSARLFVAMVLETAIIELDADETVPPARAVLWRLAGVTAGSSTPSAPSA